MVGTMASAYEALSEQDRERVFLLAVGRNVLQDSDSNFCQGFAACHDRSNSDPWWNSWDAKERDVFFFVKNKDGSWEFYCRYSMNSNRDEFDDTIQELLSVAGTEYSAKGSETIPPTSNNSTTEDSGIDTNTASTATYGSNFAWFPNCLTLLLLSVIISGWSVIL